MGWRDNDNLSRLKKHFVVSIMGLGSLSFSIFLVTGGTALYWVWPRANLLAAQPYLPWARNFGMLAMACATMAFGTLFSPNIFPLPPKTRLLLSLLATATIGFFSEFRNEGKFYFKKLVHFFGPGTWIHDGLNQIVPSLGDSLYRIEYSHWNDFLMGPAIVSVLFVVAFVKIYGAVPNQTALTLGAPPLAESNDLDHALRFARILMNVGLFWFFIDAWAEKAGYLSNPHSNDEIDLPFEFAGTMVGFWMVRVLTKPFDEPPEKFRSTVLIDFVASGLMGLLYTLLVGPLTEGVASTVAHALYPVVPGSLDVHEYTPFQQHVRPFELLLLAGAMWWSLSRPSKNQAFAQLRSSDEQPEIESKWNALATLVKVLGTAAGYLLLVGMMLSLLQPQGLGWTLTTAGAGLGVGVVAHLLVRRSARQSLTTILVENDHASKE